MKEEKHAPDDTRCEGDVGKKSLHVSAYDANSLWIAAYVRDIGEGINFSQDACSLIN